MFKKGQWVQLTADAVEYYGEENDHIFDGAFQIADIIPETNPSADDDNLYFLQDQYGNPLHFGIYGFELEAADSN